MLSDDCCVRGVGRGGKRGDGLEYIRIERYYMQRTLSCRSLSAAAWAFLRTILLCGCWYSVNLKTINNEKPSLNVQIQCHGTASTRTTPFARAMMIYFAELVTGTSIHKGCGTPNRFLNRRRISQRCRKDKSPRTNWRPERYRDEFFRDNEEECW